MRQLFTLILFFFLGTVVGQIPNQSLSGYIIDEYTGEPVDAKILLSDFVQNFETQTDSTGAFEFMVPVGRYQLTISAGGFESLLINEILLETGKAWTEILTLSAQVSDLEIVEIVASRQGISPLHSLMNSRIISVEQTRRFPATFFDPARLATATAGVSSINDQANNIVVRGNNPNGIAWYLEGLEIVNPNHLSNAGTFNDRVSQSGGGVNILSAQLLDNTNFMNGNFPSNFGNALSGVMDMHFRKGNPKKNEYTAQIGVIGLEAAIEGPIDKKQASSFLVNYRYSTLGLLSQLGVDLGDEAISFQDIAFHVNLPTKKLGDFSLFGLMGTSKNEFMAKKDSLGFAFAKDRYDIAFKNEMMAVGLKHKFNFKGKNRINTAVAFSGLKNQRKAERYNDQLTTIESTDLDRLEKFRVSFQSTYDLWIDPSSLLSFGVNVNHTDTEMERIENDLNQVKGNGEGWLTRTFVNFRKQYRQLSFNLGLHHMFFTFNKSQSIEPRLSLQYRLKSNQEIRFAYSLHSQLQIPQLYFTFQDMENPNKDLGLSKSHHLGLSWVNYFKSDYKLSVETYYQHLYDIPVDKASETSFSTLNLVDEFVGQALDNKGTGTNYGLEVSLEKFFNKNYYFLINGALFESNYKGSDGIERAARFNGKYILNATGGKEFSWTKKSKKLILGVNLRISYLGGFREREIDVAGSILEYETVYLSSVFTKEQPQFFKTDFRIYYKRNKKRFNSTLSLDIQNITNAKNEAFNYFDVEQGEVVTKFQLGLIPILNYRIEF